MRILADHSTIGRRCLAMSCALLLSACGGGGGNHQEALQIKTLSNRADLVSDGDVLAEVVVPAGLASQAVKVTVNGEDRSSAFATRADGRTTGLLTGLKAGDNEVIASAANSRSAKLTVTNSTRGAPLFSGGFAGPYICATPSLQAASGTTPATNASGLGGAPDAACNIATEYKLYYKTTAAGCSLALPDPSPAVAPDAAAPAATAPSPVNPCFKPFDAAAAKPADLATTTNDAGLPVPYIVRVERGVMNRGIYDIAVLFDPAKPWTATEPQPQWNKKLYYQFGASTGNPRRQARPTPAWTLDMAWRAASWSCRTA